MAVALARDMETNGLARQATRRPAGGFAVAVVGFWWRCWRFLNGVVSRLLLPDGGW